MSIFFFCSLPLSVVQRPLQKTPVWRDRSHHHESARSKNSPCDLCYRSISPLKKIPPWDFLFNFILQLVDFVWRCLTVLSPHCWFVICDSNHSLLLLCFAVGLPKLPVHAAGGERSGGGHGSEEDEHQDPQQSLQWGERLRLCNIQCWQFFPDSNELAIHQNKQHSLGKIEEGRW